MYFYMKGGIVKVGGHFVVILIDGQVAGVFVIPE